jgi:hypothetical protein
MRAGSFALVVALATSAGPLTAQIADRTAQSRARSNRTGEAPRAGNRANEGRGRSSGPAVVTPQGRGRGNGRVVAPPPSRGRGNGAVVVVPRDGWELGRDAWCRDGYGNRRGARHDWFDKDGRGCDSGYVRGRRPVGVAVRASLARAHAALLAELDRDHDRWHRVHGWYPRNRGWQRSHEALHRNLERDHERWHRRSNTPFTIWPDGYRYGDEPGRARGSIVIRW